MKNFAADDLIVFVTLARNQNQIISASLSNRVMNCFAAIGDLLVRLAGFLNSHFRVGENLVWILSARIVRSKNHHVAQRSGSLTHWPTFRSVTTSAATTHRDDLSLRH